MHNRLRIYQWHLGIVYAERRIKQTFEVKCLQQLNFNGYAELRMDKVGTKMLTRELSEPLNGTVGIFYSLLVASKQQTQYGN